MAAVLEMRKNYCHGVYIATQFRACGSWISGRTPSQIDMPIADRVAGRGFNLNNDGLGL